MNTATAPPTKKINAYIPQDLHKEFYKACVDNGESMTKVLTQFIQKYVEISNRKGK